MEKIFPDRQSGSFVMYADLVATLVTMGLRTSGSAAFPQISPGANGNDLSLALCVAGIFIHSFSGISQRRTGHGRGSQVWLPDVLIVWGITKTKKAMLVVATILLLVSGNLIWLQWLTQLVFYHYFFNNQYVPIFNHTL